LPGSAAEVSLSQEFTWRVTEEDWTGRENGICLHLDHQLPGTATAKPGQGYICSFCGQNFHTGNLFFLDKLEYEEVNGGKVDERNFRSLGFLTVRWPHITNADDKDKAEMEERMRSSRGLEFSLAVKIMRDSEVKLRTNNIHLTNWDFYSLASEQNERRNLALIADAFCAEERPFVVPDPRPAEFLDEANMFLISIKVSSKQCNFQNSAFHALSKQIGSTIHNEDLSDIVIECDDGKVFHAHRFILTARSTVFLTALTRESQDFVESSQNTFKIRNSPSEAVEMMLGYIYEGRLPSGITEDLNLDLLTLAGLYDLIPLKKACGEILVKFATVSNFLTTYELLYLYFEDAAEKAGWQEKVFAVFSGPAGRAAIERLRASQEWADLCRRRPGLAMKLRHAALRSLWPS